MTATSDKIEAALAGKPLIFTSDAELQRDVLNPLRADTERVATIAALIGSGTVQRLIRSMQSRSGRPFIEMVGGAIAPEDVPGIRRVIRESVPWLGSQFELSFELHSSYRRYGTYSAVIMGSAPAPVAVADRSGPFTGSGATGRNPTEGRVPLMDQYRLWRGDAGTVERYSNPLGYLQTYLDGMTLEQRRRQGEILTGLPISSVVPDSYSRLPSRLAVLQEAARRHDLHAELIAAFLLAEQRDQSEREDAKDYTAATSILKGNTSIGLGQVVVSTARNHDLFSDTLSPAFRRQLSHADIALLLASDEFNIFAVAKYMRLVANDGATIGGRGGSLLVTRTDYPGLDFAAYRRNSAQWPADNIKALGSEYTSAPWDDVLSTGWGSFVYEAYLDITGHPPERAAPMERDLRRPRRRAS